MGLERFGVKARGTVAFLARSFLCTVGLLLTFSPSVCEAFNLDVENPSVYSGPEGSYFGYAVDFYLSDSAGASVVIGAPKANTRQVNVIEGGSVFYCPWSLSQSDCHTIEFDTAGDRTVLLNDTEHQADFKSHQWFGATVRSHGDTILACAPLYSWRTEQDVPRSDATGTCYLSVQNFTRFVEYAPCRSEISDPLGQGYCQGGFSADFTMDGKVVLGGPGSYFWQGQVISAQKEDIIKAYYPGYFMQAVEGQIQTKQLDAKHDDSYRGYSIAVGEFSGDQEEVATTDINSDGMTDLLVGAPMLMVRSSDGRLEEMGRVYVYLQRGPLDLEPRLPHLTGTQVFGRFGSTIAPLGDLNLDGFNDVAISSPFGGEDRQGLVYIYNGYSDGLREKPSQVITGQWAAGRIPASFGFALRGAKDLDMNGYPDLIVGAFGVNKAVLYRSRPIVNTTASLTVYPTMINPEEKNCVVTSGNGSIPVSCVNLSFCISAEGKHLPSNLGEPVEVRLDSLKHKQKGAVKRALFLDSQLPSLQRSVRVRHGERVCNHTKIYLKDEKDFRDKLSPIFVALNFSLDPKAAADSHSLRPILNYQTASVIEQKAQILLDCGEDNICVPDLKLSVHGDRKEVYLGDDNSLTLTFNARNEGEGGAYESELYVVLPPEADYSGIARNNESLTQLTCTYVNENQTRYLSCDLGNPMKAGTNVRQLLAVFLNCTFSSLPHKLKFILAGLVQSRKEIKNENNSHSEAVSYKLEVVVQADVILQGVSRPDKVFFPAANWKATRSYAVEQDVGPAVEHIYELLNNGPSRLGDTVLELRCPLSLQGHALLYPLEFSTKGPINCTADRNMNHRNLKLQHTSTESPVLALKAHEHRVERRDVHKNQLSCSNVECWTLQCNVGLLEKGTTAILNVRSRIWAETFTEVYTTGQLQVLKSTILFFIFARLPQVVTPVVWNKPDIENSVPLWIIILAILAGLLLLALLIYVLYRFGFFKRSLPYGTAMEKAQLKPQAASEA
uniref:Integrin, alpha 5 (fibronectin receptor, alpha polypeptide) n=1 Tax=Salarias fasciatus TaxID=181472 RepID=A0A672G3U1_SALFA